MCTSPIIVYQSCCVPFPWGWDTERQPLSLLIPVPLLCTSPVVFYFPEVGTQGQPLSLSVPVPLLCTSPVVFHFREVRTQRDNLYPYVHLSHYCVPVPLCPISMRLGHGGTTSIPIYTSPITVYQSCCLLIPWGWDTGTTSIPICTSPIIVYRSCYLPFPWGWDMEGQPLSLLVPVLLLCTTPVVSHLIIVIIIIVLLKCKILSRETILSLSLIHIWRCRRWP